MLCQQPESLDNALHHSGRDIDAAAFAGDMKPYPVELGFRFGREAEFAHQRELCSAANRAIPRRFVSATSWAASSDFRYRGLRLARVTLPPGQWRQGFPADGARAFPKATWPAAPLLPCGDASPSHWPDGRMPLDPSVPSLPIGRVSLVSMACPADASCSVVRGASIVQAL